MNFDIVIGNPPYQLEGASGGNNDAPIYQIFAKIATSISTQYVSLIIKSAWFTTGRENLLRDFRHHMLTSRTVSRLVVYPNSNILFPDVEIKGGCCFYLEDKKYRGKCEYTLVNNGIEETSMRKLDAFDVLIRDPKVSTITKNPQAISMAISIAVKSLNTMHHDSMSVNFVRFVHTFPLPHNAT